jgi:predicted Zn-dependent peptidase
MTPEYDDRTLGNGLRVLALRKGSGPLVEVRLQIPAPAFTARRVAEQTMLAACLATRHTAGRTAATPVAAAAEFAAWSDYRRVGLSCSTAAGGLDTALRTLSDAIAGVSMTDAEYQSERAQQVTRLRLLGADPDTRTRTELTRRLFAGHPVTTQVPDAAEVAAVSADDVRRIAGATLRPNGAMLVIVGSDEPGRSAGLAESLLGDWPAGDPRPAMPPLPSPRPGDIRVVPVPGAARTQIRLRASAVPNGDPRYAALMLASNLLGAGTSSRLAQDLREHKGYVYGLSCYLEPVPGGTLIALEADTATATAVPAFEALVAQLRQLRTSPPTADEIDAARRRALGATAISFASRAAMASALAARAVTGVDPLSLFGIADRFRAVVPEAVGDAAGFFAPDRFAGVVAGDLPATTRLEMGT